MKNINIKGPIISNNDKWVYDWLEMEATCPNDVAEVLNELGGEPVQLTINSGGGDVYSASEIFTELKSYQGEVTSRIVGICASAASVIAMAGNKVEMSPTAEIMIHNASTITWGDHQEMDKTSNFLKKVDKSIASAYRLKTGLSEEELLNLMGEETWLTAEEAKEKGFVDEVMFENEEIRAVASAPGALSSEAIAKIRNSLQKESKGITMDELKNALNEYKEDMVAEVAERVKNTTTKQDPKEPDPEPENNGAVKRLFLNL